MTSGKRDERRVVWIAAAIQLVNMIDFMMVMPLGPDITGGLGISNADIGYIGGSYTLAVAFSGLVCVRFLDRFDRKSVALAAVFGLCAATFCAVLTWNLTGLVLARILAGCFGGPATAISLSMVADTVPPKRRAKAMAIVMGSFSVSSILAVPFGLELSSMFGWQAPFYGISIIGIAVLIGIRLVCPSMRKHLEAKEIHKPGIWNLLSNSEARTALLMMGSAMFAGFLLIPNMSAYYQFNLGFPRQSLGILYFCGGLCSLVVLQIAGRLADRFGPLSIVLAGTAILISAIFDTFMKPPVLPTILICVVIMGSMSIRNVSASSEASKIPKPYERAAFMSLLSSLQHIASGLAALISAAILTTTENGSLIGMDKVAWLAILFAVFQPFLLMKLTRRKPEEAIIQ